MHFAVFSTNIFLRIEDDGGVVINAGGAALEQRCDDDELEFGRERTDALGARPGNGFGAIEFGHAFVLAEIRPVVQLLQQHEFCAGLGCFAQTGFDRIEIRFTAAAVGFLQQRDAQCLAHFKTP